ncbi:MAG TPA: EamA family transporter [Bryobacteraceae bacterium]|nr:EamA family transporter [Bryobacteraceae bacterium]
MAWQEVFEVALIAMGMASWPILGKYSQASPGWISAIVLGVTGIVAITIAWLQGGQQAAALPAPGKLLILIAAGVVNGLATYRYALRARMEGQTGKYLVLVAVLIVIEAPFFDMFLNRSSLTVRQWTGVGCGVACVYLLGMK